MFALRALPKRPDAHDHAEWRRDRKQERQCRFQHAAQTAERAPPVALRLLWERARGERGRERCDADAEREPFEELVECDGGDEGSCVK